MCPQYFLTIIFALWLSDATAASHAQTYRFDFGSSKVAEGFQAVTSSMTYNSDRGFGFEPGAIPIDVVRENFGVNVRTPQLSKGNAIKLNSRELDYESGMTIKGFRFGRRWDKIMESAHPGDYLLIQLGTNDEKKRGHDPMWDAADYAGDWVRTHSDPEKDYVWGLATMALEAKRHGIIPIIVSPMTKIDRKTATATEVMTSYGTNARRGAELGECAYVDLWGVRKPATSAANGQTEFGPL